jgi:hypothetical protein
MTKTRNEFPFLEAAIKRAMRNGLPDVFHILGADGESARPYDQRVSRAANFLEDTAQTIARTRNIDLELVLLAIMETVLQRNESLPIEGSVLSQAFLTEPSPFEPDGLHFTIEWKTLKLKQAAWECVERSWELPEPIVDRQQAEAVARALALAADGERVYRVIDPRGTPLLAYVVKKYLALLEQGQVVEQQEMLPAGFEGPALSTESIPIE